jgi:hypothetical protein
MRIFWFNNDDTEQPLTLLHQTPAKNLQFPLEILDHIISYLPRSSLPNVSKVSRLWYSAAMPVLYRHLYIQTLPHWLLLVRTMSDTSFAARFGVCVKSLVLKPSPRLIPAQLTSALNQSVIENDDQLQPSMRGYARLERVNYNLTGLERLSVAWYPDTNIENENHGEIDTSQKESEWLSFVKDEETVAVLSHCSQLEYLDLSGCEHLTDSTLFALASSKQDGCPLVGLWLSLMREVSAEGINALLQAEKSKTSKLKYLDISFLLRLRNQTIQDIAEQWGPSLTHLRLNSISELTDTAAHAIAKCERLELLYLTRCWKLSNSAIGLLARGCSQLKYVSIAYLNSTNEEGIKHFIHSCPRLVWLDVSGCGINSLFKPMILASWDTFRRDHNFGLVTIKDHTMFTL